MKRFAQFLVGFLAVLSFATAGAADLVEGQALRAAEGAAAGRNRQEDRGHRILFLRLPALQRSRAVPGQLVQDAACRRAVPARAGDVPGALEGAGQGSITRSTRWARKRGCRPKCSRRSTPMASRSGRTRRFSTGRPARGSIAPRSPSIYTSFGVDSKMKRAMALAQTYNIQSVPTVVVDGKFITSSDRIGGHAEMPAALDALIAKARAERAKS